MSEKLLQAILDELISLNKKVGNIEEVVEIISGKMNESEEQLDKMINSFQAINKNIDGVRDDITDLEKKVIPVVHLEIKIKKIVQLNKNSYI